MVWIENNFSDSFLNGAVFLDPDGKLDGDILFYEGEIRDGMGDVAGKRLFGFYTELSAYSARREVEGRSSFSQAGEKDVKPVSPAII